MAVIVPFRATFSAGLLRRLARAGIVPHSDLSDASAERYARELLARQGAISAADLTAAVRSWLARRERGIGGGVADLGLWGDALWQQEAECVVARVMGNGGERERGEAGMLSC